MNDLARYIEVIVEPTFAEFSARPSSRLAFLTCVAIFHALDRAAYPKSASVLRQAWCRQSLEFKLVDVIAHHFKHVKSSDERIINRPGISISHLFRFNAEGDEMERHAVVFGKASSCENPVLVRLNDRDDFLEVFREQHPPPEKADAELVEELLDAVVAEAPLAAEAAPPPEGDDDFWAGLEANDDPGEVV